MWNPRASQSYETKVLAASVVQYVGLKARSIKTLCYALCLCYQFPVKCNFRHFAAPSSRVQPGSDKFAAMCETAKILRQDQGHLRK